MFNKIKQRRYDRIYLIGDIELLTIAIEYNINLYFTSNGQYLNSDIVKEKLTTQAIYDLYESYTKYYKKLIRKAGMTYSLKKLNWVINELELMLKKVRMINDGYGVSDYEDYIEELKAKYV